jgi:hypothetical protein
MTNIKVRNQWAEQAPFRWFNDDNTVSEMVIPWSMFGSFGGGTLISLFGWGYAYGWVPTVIFTVAFLIGWNFVPFAFKFSELSKIDNSTGSIGYYPSYGSADLLRKVRELPAEDQRLFPAGIVETLSRDLLPAERRKINQGIWDTLEEIKQRNLHRREMEQRAIPTEGVLAALEDARTNVKVETDTLRDFM